MLWNSKEVCDGFESYRDYPEELLGYRMLLGEIDRRENIGGSEKVILDYGCGPGKCSLRLATRGCGRVVAVDQSERMLEMARRLRSHPKIEYMPVHDDRIDLAEASVDVAICCFVFINTESVGRIQNAMRNIKYALKPEGYFYILDTNPDTTGRRFSTFVSGAPGRQYEAGELRTVRLFRGENECLRVEDYHWPKQVYLDCLQQSGFENIEMSEPILADVSEVERRSFFDEHGFDDWKDESTSPPFIIIKATSASAKL